MKTVMCFGTFDILHLGHLYYFEHAKKYGDYLIVVIARDKTKQQQQKETVFSEKERLKLIKCLRMVNEAVLGNIDDHLRIILERKPDVLCLGYDHPISEKELQQRLRQRGLTPRIVRIKAYSPHSQKSGKIKQFLLRKI